MADLKSEELFMDADTQKSSIIEEIISLDESSSSDLEIIAVSKSIKERTKKIKKINNGYTKIHVKSVNNPDSSEQDSYIKEEIIISDESDCLDEDKSNLNYLKKSGTCMNFTNRSKRIVRNKESHSSIILNCPKCNKTETVFSATITCTCKDCKINMYYVCNECNLRYETMLALYRHKKLQCKTKKLLKNFILKCQECELIKELDNSRKISKCSSCKKNMKFVCIVCDKIYVSYSGIYKHNRTNCQSSTSPMFCSLCNFSCTRKNFMIGHISKFHSNISELACQKCGRIFSDVQCRKYHELNVCEQLYYHCKYCSSKNKSLENLKEHIIDNHPEKLKNKSTDDIIEEIVNEKNATDNTKKKKTNQVINNFSLVEIKRSFCPHCNKFMKYTGARKCIDCKTNLRYQCNICSKMLAAPTLLWRHSYRSHGKNIHPCSHCGKKFSYKGDASFHEKRCGQDPNFECSLCYFKTRYRYNLKKHLFKIHKTIFNCSYCGDVFESDNRLIAHRKMCYYYQKNVTNKDSVIESST